MKSVTQYVRAAQRIKVGLQGVLKCVTCCLLYEIFKSTIILQIIFQCTQ